LSRLNNTRHELIAQHRSNGMEWGECYRLAGYKGGDLTACAQKMLARHPEVRERVNELLEIRAHASTTLHTYGKTEIVAGLLKNARMGQSPIPVNNNKGEATGNVKYDLTASNRAFELLGMELGMFPKVSKLQHGKLDPLEGLEQAEVLKLAELAASMSN